MTELPVDNKVIEELIRRAKDASTRAYARYSNFHVGAALLDGSGQIHDGCNVENASYGGTFCAERTAIVKMISEWRKAGHEPSVVVIVVYTPTPTATPPCGFCRQVINEFGPTARVISVCDSDERIDLTLEELLPHAFGPGNLKKEKVH